MKIRLAMVTMLFIWLQSAIATAAGGRILPFSGRLLDDQGKAVTGPVDLQLNFFKTEADATPLPLPPYNFYKMDLTDGVFHLKIMASENDMVTLSNPNNLVYLQVRDATHDRVYRRQKFDLATAETPPAETAPAPTPAQVTSSVTAPAAASGTTAGVSSGTGIDQEMLRASTGACLASPGPGAKFVTVHAEASGSQTCGAVCSRAAVGAACIRGWTVFADSQQLEFGSECSATPVLASTPVVGRLCCCLNLRGPAPLQLQGNQGNPANR
ncbi:MAG: hypothetical protein FJ146_08340 [Deltaproteobacteria bacterium]|nr:hypothetical protein [Deltaproteobacteria bacterium]